MNGECLRFLGSQETEKSAQKAGTTLGSSDRFANNLNRLGVRMVGNVMNRSRLVSRRLDDRLESMLNHRLDGIGGLRLVVRWLWGFVFGLVI